jgi:CRISPR-associated protein Csb2
MGLVIEQKFPLGKFHATRWKQGSFGDPFGEWPPSPYRLLRTLCMRWFQYAREMGWNKDEESMKRKNKLYPLLEAISSSLPCYHLPAHTHRGPAIRQYQPAEFEWTSKNRTEPAYKKHIPTLVEDHYRLIPPDSALYWFWEDLDMSDELITLLDALLARVIYFGRAESFCRMRRLDDLPDGMEINCRLEENGDDRSFPVLAPIPGKFSLETLLLPTGNDQISTTPVPPGARWYYATIPEPPKPVRKPAPKVRYPSELRCLQFAVGGRVFPPVRLWVRVTERFRGRVLRELARIVSPYSDGDYSRLDMASREKLALMSGKDGHGKALEGHRHAYFLLLPDENKSPTRLVVFRSEPFSAEEIEAMLRASEVPIVWDRSASEWKVSLVPLPFDMPQPKILLGSSRVWQSVTPFVPPAQRHRFRKNGRKRTGESLERIVSKLLDGTAVVEKLEEIDEVTWVTLHETRERRRLRKETGTPWMRPGYRLRITFDNEVRAPLIIGDSCHFGLGLFAPVG